MAAVPRLVIMARHRGDYFIDLGLYWSSGKLAASGVNVYDYSDNTALRRQLFEYHRDQLHWTYPKTQEQWDYYTAGNLPLTQTIFGAIYRASPKPTAFKLAFLLFDVLVTPLAFLLIRDRWRIASPLFAAGMALALGANLVFLKWGTVYPEDKGLQTVLVFTTLLVCAPRPDSRLASWSRLITAGVIEGLSICFKAMGIFFLPVALAWAWRERGRKGAAVLTAVVGATCLAINGPYVGAILRLTATRVGIDTGSRPKHSSIWSLLGPFWDHVAWLHPNVLAATVGFVVLTLLLRRGKIGLACWGAACCVLLNVVLLVFGSMDRVLMGVMPLILTLGFERPSWGVTSLAVWTLVSVPIKRVPEEAQEAIFLALALVLAALAFATGVPGFIERHLRRWIPGPSLAGERSVRDSPVIG
jgi:hypothetical protein